MSLHGTIHRTDAEFLDYVNSNFYKNTSRAAVEQLLELYPAAPAAGSPFGTGDQFAFSPQFKRMAALQGDLIQQAPRRLLGRELSSRQPVYTYRTSSALSLPDRASAHWHYNSRISERDERSRGPWCSMRSADVPLSCRPCPDPERDL